ncbi:MAG: bifunctional D-glycero-beta-D-manno-heptose-7-phosphate kinase/D-glycero-beta-D-manno-heptose 1-phosphate adenylyltransferase HldE [Gammaproteobacteria bacterium]|nr:bifunctional D-glycero-beta-D-manno-heptose-7-phosphate kinase/D-glycero-beta-D-manno-heptose 1-phosphate adenylyltransferase HldE [Gammaproteobacteria bacterium]
MTAARTAAMPLLPSLRDLHAVVVGDLMLDRYWQGEARRISPEAPVPVVAISEVEDRPGGAANVALNVASLGARCTLLGCVGKDAEGAALRSILEAAGVTCEFVEIDGWATTLKLRVVSQQQQLLRNDFESPVPAAAAQELVTKASAYLADAAVLIVADYDKSAVADPAALIQAANATGTASVVDPKYKPLSSYAGASLLKPNRQEFAAAAGQFGDVDALAEAARSLCRAHDFDAMVVTAGADGMTVVDGPHTHHLPARQVEVYDVTGAGDTAAAVLGVALGARLPVLDCARLANVAASLAVAKSGTAAVSGPELALAATQESADGGVLSADQLALAVAASRQAGERIIFTNGCFDILHAGHVAYLEQARGLGDRLIVAVNSDASVARIKGPERPVNALARRMQVLAGLKSVDWVVSFDEDTPEPLLNRFRPDVLAKGGDYERHQVVGADLVASYGGEVRVLDRVEDCSTTAILDRLTDHP